MATMAEAAHEDQDQPAFEQPAASEAADACVGVASLAGPEPADDVAEGEAAPGSQAATVEERPDRRLDKLLYRINQLRMGVGGAPEKVDRPSTGKNVFFPVEPVSWEQTQVNESAVEALCMKYLLACGSAPAWKWPNR